MKKILVVFAICAVFFAVSCGDGTKKVNLDEDGKTSGGRGELNGVCYPNGTCNEGLVCDEENNLCIEDSENPVDDSDSGTSSEQNDSDSDNPVTDPTPEGLYVGVIGFNKNLPLNTFEIGMLDASSVYAYRSFIDSLYPDEGTSLYFADYTALDMMVSHNEPENLKHVALITFTDGLDNLAMNQNYNPDKYKSRDEYLSAIHKKIIDEKGIHDKEVEAYAIGLNGKEEGIDPDEFEETLKNLSSCKDLDGSCEENVSMVSNMESAKESFRKIAQSLYYATRTVNLDVKVPDGYDDGQLLRFTFDDLGENSELYIAAKFHRSDDARTLEEISYHGFVKGKITISGTLDSDGAYYHFVFEDLKYESDNTPLSDSDINKIKLWVQNKNKETWKTDSEFGRQNSVNVEEHRSSALIMLVLDCTTSLGSDFGTMQQAGKEFIDTLVSGSSSGNGGNSSTLPECSTADVTPCKDSSTNYIWSERYDGMEWQAAVDHCEDLNSSNYGGYSSGWHLPTIDELRTLIKNCAGSQTGGSCAVQDPSCLSYSCYSSNCYCSYMENNGGYYSTLGDDDTVYLWSSSTRSDDVDTAWGAGFHYGSVSTRDKWNSLNVRCVR